MTTHRVVVAGTGDAQDVSDGKGGTVSLGPGKPYETRDAEAAARVTDAAAHAFGPENVSREILVDDQEQAPAPAKRPPKRTPS
jgi:hypothetical protein